MSQTPNLKEFALSGIYRLLDHKNAQQYVLLQKYCMKALGSFSIDFPFV